MVAANNPILDVTEELTGANMIKQKVNDYTLFQQSFGQDTKPSTSLFSDAIKTVASKRNKIRAIIPAEMSLFIPRRKVESIFNLQRSLAPSDIEDRICDSPITTKSDIININQKVGVENHGALSICCFEPVQGFFAPKSCYPDGRLCASQAKPYPRSTSTYFKPIKSDN